MRSTIRILFPMLVFASWLQLPIGRSRLGEEVEKFRQQLAKHDLTFGTAAVSLHNMLVKPAMGQLRGKTNLIIVRDAGLWELPFQALRNEAGRFLIEDFAVSYAPLADCTGRDGQTATCPPKPTK